MEAELKNLCSDEGGAFQQVLEKFVGFAVGRAEAKEEEEVEQAKGKKGPLGPVKCQDCEKILPISDYAEEAYSTGFICNGCEGHLKGKRWFCQGCTNDYCFQCEPEERWNSFEGEARGIVEVEPTLSVSAKKTAGDAMGRFTVYSHVPASDSFERKTFDSLDAADRYTSARRGVSFVTRHFAKAVRSHYQSDEVSQRLGAHVAQQENADFVVCNTLLHDHPLAFVGDSAAVWQGVLCDGEDEPGGCRAPGLSENCPERGAGMSRWRCVYGCDVDLCAKCLANWPPSSSSSSMFQVNQRKLDIEVPNADSLEESFISYIHGELRNPALLRPKNQPACESLRGSFSDVKQALEPIFSLLAQASSGNTESSDGGEGTGDSDNLSVATLTPQRSLATVTSSPQMTVLSQLSSHPELFCIQAGIESVFLLLQHSLDRDVQLFQKLVSLLELYALQLQPLSLSTLMDDTSVMSEKTAKRSLFAASLEKVSTVLEECFTSDSCDPMVQQRAFVILLRINAAIGSTTKLLELVGKLLPNGAGILPGGRFPVALVQPLLDCLALESYKLGGAALLQSSESLKEGSNGAPASPSTYYYPNCWDATKCHDSMSIEKLWNVERTGTATGATVALARTIWPSAGFPEHPEQDICYMEIRVEGLTPSATVHLGLAEPSFSKIRHLGKGMISYGYGSNGRFYSGGSAGRPYGTAWGVGDVIGVGWVVSKKSIFFTKNGTKLPIAQTRGSSFLKNLYPAVSFEGCAHINARFAPPFRYNAEGIPTSQSANPLALFTEGSQIRESARWNPLLFCGLHTAPICAACPGGSTSLQAVRASKTSESSSCCSSLLASSSSSSAKQQVASSSSSLSSSSTVEQEATDEQQTVEAVLCTICSHKCGSAHWSCNQCGKFNTCFTCFPDLPEETMAEELRSASEISAANVAAAVLASLDIGAQRFFSEVPEKKRLPLGLDLSKELFETLAAALQRSLSSDTAVPYLQIGLLRILKANVYQLASRKKKLIAACMGDVNDELSVRHRLRNLLDTFIDDKRAEDATSQAATLARESVETLALGFSVFHATSASKMLLQLLGGLREGKLTEARQNLLRFLLASQDKNNVAAMLLSGDCSDLMKSCMAINVSRTSQLLASSELSADEGNDKVSSAPLFIISSIQALLAGGFDPKKPLPSHEQQLRNGQLREYMLHLFRHAADLLQVAAKITSDNDTWNPAVLKRAFESSLVVLLPSLAAASSTVRPDSLAIFRGAHAQSDRSCLEMIIAPLGELATNVERRHKQAVAAGEESIVKPLTSFVARILTTVMFFFTQLAQTWVKQDVSLQEGLVETTIFHSELVRNGSLAQRDSSKQLFIDQFIENTGDAGKLWTVLRRSTLSMSARPFSTTRNESVDRAIRAVIMTVLYHIGQLDEVIESAGNWDSKEKLDPSKPVRKVYNQVIKMKRWFIQQKTQAPNSDEDAASDPTPTYTYEAIAARVIGNCHFLLGFAPCLPQDFPVAARDSSDSLKQKRAPSTETHINLRQRLKFKNADPRLNVFNAVLFFVQNLEPLPAQPSSNDDNKENKPAAGSSKSSSSASSSPAIEQKFLSPNRATLTESTGASFPSTLRECAGYNKHLEALVVAREERAKSMSCGLRLLSSLLKATSVSSTKSALGNFRPVVLEALSKTIGAQEDGQQYHYFSAVWGGATAETMDELYEGMTTLWNRLLACIADQSADETCALNALMPLALTYSTKLGVERDYELVYKTKSLQRLLQLSLSAQTSPVVKKLTWQILRLQLNQLLDLGAARKYHIPIVVAEGQPLPSLLISDILLQHLAGCAKLLGGLTSTDSADPSAVNKLTKILSLLLALCHHRNIEQQICDPKWLAVLQQLIESTWIQVHCGGLIPLLVSTLKFVLPNQDPLTVLSKENNIVQSLLTLIGRTLVASPPPKQHWSASTGTASSTASSPASSSNTTTTTTTSDDGEAGVDRVPESRIAVAALVVLRTLHRRETWRDYTTQLFSALLQGLPRLIKEAKDGTRLTPPSADAEKALSVLFVLGGSLPSLAPGMRVTYKNPTSDLLETSLLMPEPLGGAQGAAPSTLRVLPTGATEAIDIPSSLVTSVDDQAPLLSVEPFADMLIAGWNGVVDMDVSVSTPLFFHQARLALTRLIYRSLRSAQSISFFAKHKSFPVSMVKFANSHRAHVVVSELEYQLVLADKELRKRFRSPDGTEEREITLAERAAFFERTQRLEARDITEPDKIRPYHVFDKDGPFIRIRADGHDQGNKDYWARVDSPNIGPIGSAKLLRQKLEKPRAFGKRQKFSWEPYLKTKNVKAVPSEAFVFATIRPFAKQNCFLPAKYVRGKFHQNPPSERISGISVDSEAQVIGGDEDNESGGVLGAVLKSVFLAEERYGSDYSTHSLEEHRAGSGSVHFLKNRTLDCADMDMTEFTNNLASWLQLLSVGYARKIVGTLFAEKKQLGKQLSAIDLLGLYESLEGESVHGKVRKALISCFSDDTSNQSANLFAEHIRERLVLANQGFTTLYETPHPYNEDTATEQRTFRAAGAVHSYRIIFDPRSKLRDGDKFIFNWNTGRQQRVFSSALPFQAFTLPAYTFGAGLVTNGNAANLGQGKVTSLIDDKPWEQLKAGMRVEAVDIKTSRYVCVATISDVDGTMVRIHFDGWGENFDYWCPYNHPNLGAPGNCAMIGHVLQKPRGLNGLFIWDDFLEENDVLPVPAEMYNAHGLHLKLPSTWSETAVNTFAHSAYVRGSHQSLYKVYDGASASASEADGAATESLAVVAAAASSSSSSSSTSSEAASVSLTPKRDMLIASTEGTHEDWGVRFVAIPYFESAPRPLNTAASLLSVALATDSLKERIVACKAVLQALLQTIALSRMETRRVAMQLLCQFLYHLRDVANESVEGETALVETIDNPVNTFGHIHHLASKVVRETAQSPLLPMFSQAIAELMAEIHEVCVFFYAAEKRATARKKKLEEARKKAELEARAAAASSSSSSSSSSSTSSEGPSPVATGEEEDVGVVAEGKLASLWWLKAFVGGKQLKQGLPFLGEEDLSDTARDDQNVPPAAMIAHKRLNNYMRVESCQAGMKTFKPCRNVLINNTRNAFTSDSGQSCNVNIVIRCIVRLAITGFTLRRLSTYIGRSAAGTGLILVSDTQPNNEDLKKFDNFDQEQTETWLKENPDTAKTGELRPVSFWSFVGTRDLSKKAELPTTVFANWVILKLIRPMTSYTREVHLEFAGFRGYPVHTCFRNQAVLKIAEASASKDKAQDKRKGKGKGKGSGKEEEEPEDNKLVASKERGFTLDCAWFYMPDTDGGKRVLAATDSGDSLLMVCGGQLGVYSEKDKKFIGSGYSFSMGGARWVHIIARAKGGVTEFFVDSERVGEAACQPTGALATIGNTLHPDKGDYAFGRIRSLKIYDEWLSDEGLAQMLWAEGKFGICTWPAVKWERIAYGNPKQLGLGHWKTEGGGYPTMRATPGVSLGRWYYEVEIKQDAMGQIGWINLGVAFSSGKGVGDDDHGFAYDGNRVKRWHRTSESWGERWAVGDVIGCLLDLPKREISFTRNGKSMGVAFDSSTVEAMGKQVWYPAWTIASPAEVVVNLGWAPWKFQPPVGFLGAWDATNEISAGKEAPSLQITELNPNAAATSSATASAASLRSTLQTHPKISKFASQVSVLRAFAERLQLSSAWEDSVTAGVTEAVKIKARKIHWSAAMDMQIVEVVNGMKSTSDVLLLPPAAFRMSATDKQTYLLIANVDLQLLRWRLQVLQGLNSTVKEMLPLVNLTETDRKGSVAEMVVRVKSLIFTDVKQRWMQEQFSKYRGSRSRPEVSVRRLRNLTRDGASDHYTTFGTFFRHMAQLPAEHWQVQKGGRHWETKFIGEGSIDDGGPYRESRTIICDELCSERTSLFTLCPNGTGNVGLNRDTYVIHPQARSPKQLAMFRFVGRLIGGAIFAEDLMNVRFPSTFWSRLVGDRLAMRHLQDVDAIGYQQLSRMLDEFQPFQTFITNLPDESIVELVPDGESVDVTPENIKKFVELAVHRKLHYDDAQMDAILDGLGSALPLPLLRLYTWQELNVMVCGIDDYDVNVLATRASIGGNLRNKPIITWLWSTLREFTAEQRQQFLRFTSGQSRLPDPNSPNFKRLQVCRMSSSQPDLQLPKAATCYAKLYLPEYTSASILADKLKFAIVHGMAIDTDGGPQLASASSSSETDIDD